MPNPRQLSIQKLSLLLRQAGSKHAKRATIEKHFDRGGAPQNEDGSIDLVHYLAWLIKENHGWA